MDTMNRVRGKRYKVKREEKIFHRRTQKMSNQDNKSLTPNGKVSNLDSKKSSLDTRCRSGKTKKSSLDCTQGHGGPNKDKTKGATLRGELCPLMSKVP